MGSQKGNIGDKYSFLLLTPVGTSRVLEDVEIGIQLGVTSVPLGILLPRCTGLSEGSLIEVL